MLTFLGRRRRFCDGVSRRDFLRVGALSVGGLTLADLLRLKAQAAVGPTPGKSVIMVFLHGGPSHLDMYDMKPQAPVEFRGEFRPIHTNVPGMDICELMPRQAQIMDKLADPARPALRRRAQRPFAVDRLSRADQPPGVRLGRQLSEGQARRAAAVRQPDEPAAVGRSGLLRHGPSAVRAHRAGPGKPGPGRRRVARPAAAIASNCWAASTRFAATSTIAAPWPASTPTPCGPSTWSPRPRRARRSTSARNRRRAREVRQGERGLSAGPAAGRGRHLGRDAGRRRLGHARQQLQRLAQPAAEARSGRSRPGERSARARAERGRGRGGVGRVRPHAARQRHGRPRSLAAGRLRRAGRRQFQDRPDRSARPTPTAKAPRACR